MVEENLGSTFVLYSTSDEMDHSVRGKEMEHVRVSIYKWYGVDCLWSSVGA